MTSAPPARPLSEGRRTGTEMGGAGGAGQLGRSLYVVSGSTDSVWESSTGGADVLAEVLPVGPGTKR